MTATINNICKPSLTNWFSPTFISILTKHHIQQIPFWDLTVLGVLAKLQ